MTQPYRPEAFNPTGWTQVTDGVTRAALGDNAQKTAALARAVKAQDAATLAAAGEYTDAAIAAIPVFVRPSFSAYDSVGTAVVGDGLFHPTGFDVEVFDTANEYDPVNNRWTPSITGPYLVTCSIQIQTGIADGSVIRACLFEDPSGADVEFCRLGRVYAAAAAATPSVGGSALVYVDSTKTYGLKFSSTAATTTSGGKKFTYWGAVYIGLEV